MVSDPTWHRDFRLGEDFDRHSQLLLPYSLALDLFSNAQFTLGYKNSTLSVIGLAENAPRRVFLPYSWKGVQVCALDPSARIPSQVSELVLGKNIISLGNVERSACGIVNLGYGDALERLFIHAENPSLESSGGAVYRKGDHALLFVMNVAEVTLKYGSTFGKNAIKSRPKLRVLTFPQTATRIEEYAVEECPKLARVVVPKGCEYHKDSFYRCSPSLTVEER